MPGRARLFGPRALPALLLAGWACGSGGETPSPGPGDGTVLGVKTQAAHAAFWSAFRAGRYEAIDGVLAQLAEAETEDPRNPSTPAFRGFLHIWRIAENVRGGGLPTIIEENAAARAGFARALELDPTDARIEGFLAATLQLQGMLTGDASTQAEGEAAMQRAVEAWPEFNLFTAGYMRSMDPPSWPSFQNALEQQWRNLEICLGVPIDRTNPDLSNYAGRLDASPAKLACGDQGLAPHNTKGFVLNMGDMLVKSGDWMVAQQIYRAATFLEGYSAWPYREVLEARIRDAEANVARFRQPPPGEPVDTLMFASKMSCMGCHQTEP